jgi:capsular exopolysaccharide synthesis family protein
MNDQPNGTDGNEEADFLAAAQAPLDALRPNGSTALVKRPASAFEAAASADRESGGSSGSGGVAGYLHAYRRRWFVATSLGLICGVAAAVATWLTATPAFTTTSLIRIAADNDGPVPDEKAHFSYELYKGTQMQMLTSDFVLIAALRDPEVANLDVVKREDDPIRWLAKSLEVQAPENAETLRISLTTPSRDAGAAIVNAIVNAYISEVAGKEGKARNVRHADLERLYSLQEQLLIANRRDLKNLEDQVGSGDKGALSQKELLALQEYAEARAKLTRVQDALRAIEFEIAQLEAKMAAVKAGRLKPASPAEIENAVNSDAESLKLQQDLAALDNELSGAKSVVKEHSRAGTLIEGQYASARKALEAKLATRRKQIAERLKIVKAGDTDSLQTEADGLQSRRASLVQDEEQASKDLATKKAQTDLIGRSSVEIEMRREELGETKKTFDSLAHQRENARMESESQSSARISVLQPAIPPAAPNRSSRAQNAIAGGLFGFLTPVGLLLWWDVRARRINSLGDISQGLGLRVIGTVPHITSSARSRTKPNSRKQRKMQICLDHSIDGIAAKLCLRRDSRNARVVLVSSATHGEGKSTLSLQLAKRLARTGASTLLVDFDLRKPTMHHVFDVPRSPGLSEFLRGENELGALVRTTDIDHLSVLPAGSPFSDSLGTLSNGVTRSLFKQVRDQFEFVVVDGSPILPVVDSLLASQHVDSVVLSIRRDVSTARRVQSACNQLTQFGVEEVVAVLTGSNEDLYYYDHGQEPMALTADDKPKPR